MRIKMAVAGMMALFMAQGALAQGGGGQPRPPEPPELSVAPIVVEERAAPVLSAIAPAAIPENLWVLDLSDGGRVTIQLRPDHAPRHVERVKSLTRRGFYDGLSFHRVIEGFMAQGGDPTGTGRGASDLPDIGAEFNALPHLRGTVAMARAEAPDSANSQFYIMFVPRLAMDGKYTVFGRVLGGMEHVDKISRGAPPAVPTRIVRASIGSDNAPRPTAEEIAAVANRPAPGAPPQLQALDVQSLTGAAPAQSAPALSAPAQSAPAQTPPAQPAPAQPAPAQTPPSQTPPTQPAPAPQGTPPAPAPTPQN